METFTIKTNQRNEFIDITYLVQKALEKSGKIDGIITIYCPHTTGAITINENADPDVPCDMLKKLNAMVPPNEGYAHMEGNSDSHIKSSLIGNSNQIIVENGKLLLGTWQGIYFVSLMGQEYEKFGLNDLHN